jgi:hypothetical protein
MVIISSPRFRTAFGTEATGGQLGARGPVLPEALTKGTFVKFEAPRVTAVVEPQGRRMHYCP